LGPAACRFWRTARQARVAAVALALFLPGDGGLFFTPTSPIPIRSSCRRLTGYALSIGQFSIITYPPEFHRFMAAGERRKWFLEPPIGEEIAQTQCFDFMTSFHVLQKLLPATQQELLSSNTRLAEIFLPGARRAEMTGVQRWSQALASHFGQREDGGDAEGSPAILAPVVKAAKGGRRSRLLL
jgi:hypothetical protein